MSSRSSHPQQHSIMSVRMQSIPARPRPTSLYLPDLSSDTRPIVSSSSYSPFPMFPGARNDGLDAFLLPPDVSSTWNGTATHSRSLGDLREVSEGTSKAEEGRKPSRPTSLVSRNSFNVLRRSSPLSQPPVSAENGEQVTVRARKRSNSLGSLDTKSPRLEMSIDFSASPVLPHKDHEDEMNSNSVADAVLDDYRAPPTIQLTTPPMEQEHISDFGPTPSTPVFPTDSLSRPSMTSISSVSSVTSKSGKPGAFRRAFNSFSRNSVLKHKDLNTSTPSLSIPPNFQHSPASSSKLAANESTAPSTPLSSRSNSNYSETSSASSSTSSAEEIKTPNEALIVASEVAIAGGKLAVALQAEQQKIKNKGSWRVWLGGKRLSKLSSTSSSGTSTPTTGSVTPSPNPSTTDLVDTIPKAALTPSPAIFKSKISDPRTSYADALSADRLRQISGLKLAQIRSPSPHPLALTLKRQYSNIPNEVATSIPSGQKVFPLSVNSYDPTSSSSLNPAQGGLYVTVLIRKALDSLEAGHIPPSFSPRGPSYSRSIVRRPRGMLDFISRPPFEERNIVHYPDDISPVSMARPGYGVWDLDFSQYILALSQVDENESEAWPIFPRTSISSGLDDLATMVERYEYGYEEIDLDADISGSSTSAAMPAEDREEILQPHSFTLRSQPDADGNKLDEKQVPTRPASIPHSAKPTWDSSSEDDNDSSDEDVPLKQIRQRRSFPTVRPTSELVIPRQEDSRIRARSQPPSGISATGVPPVPPIPEFRARGSDVRRLSPNPQAGEGVRQRLKSHSAGPKLGRETGMEAQRRMLQEVVKARERQIASVKGQGEHRAEMDRLRVSKPPSAPPSRHSVYHSKAQSLDELGVRPSLDTLTHSQSTSSVRRLPQITPPAPFQNTRPSPRAKDRRSKSYYDSVSSRNDSPPRGGGRYAQPTAQAILPAYPVLPNHPGHLGHPGHPDFPAHQMSYPHVGHGHFQQPILADRGRFYGPQQRSASVSSLPANEIRQSMIPLGGVVLPSSLSQHRLGVSVGRQPARPRIT